MIDISEAAFMECVGKLFDRSPVAVEIVEVINRHLDVVGWFGVESGN